MQVGTCIVEATRWVAPVSACTSGIRSSMRSRNRSAARLSSSARSSGFVRLHAGNAAAAASVACCACSTDASGASPTICSVAGLTIP